MMKVKLEVFLMIIGIAVGTVFAGDIVNGGFETSEATSGGWPSSYGHWNGDYSAIVGSTSGITPYEGSQMLQFKGTAHTSLPSSATSSQIYNIVDISAYASVVADGKARVRVSAFFNRVNVDSQTDTAFNLMVMAYDGSPSTFSSRWENYHYDSAISYLSAGGLYSDSLPETWEKLEVVFDIPSNATFIVIGISASEDVYNDYSSSEFDGHFIDDVNVEITSSTGLVAHWTFDEENGDIAYDSVGGNDGTIVNGAARTDGVIGGALDFDGVDDYVTIPDSDTLTPSNAMTLSFWAYNRGGNYAMQIAKWASCPELSNSPGNSRAYTVNLFNDSKIINFQLHSSVDSYDIIESQQTFDFNKWHHIAVTFDSGLAAIYIDGNLDSTKSMSVSTIMNDAQPLIIGGRWYYCGTDHVEQEADGRIDDVRIYNYALDETEVEQLYNENASGLIAHWTFDEENGDIAYDSVGGNDGTIVNGAARTDGVIGGALDFDGVDDYVTIPDSDTLTPSNAMTLSFWAYNRGNTPSLAITKWVSCPEEFNSPSNSRAYALQLINSTGLVAFRVHSSVDTYQIMESQQSLQFDKWQHIVVTFDSGLANIFIDGQLDASQQLSITSIMNDAQPLMIGGHWDYCGTDELYQRADGRIDDVRLYNYALDGIEVLALYESADLRTSYHVDTVSGDDTANDGRTRETAFATIQKGVNTAKDGDTVLVWPGSYDEQVNFLGKAITVKSAEYPAVIANSTGYGFSFTTGEGNSSVLENFVIANGNYAVYVDAATPTLRNLTIANNEAGINTWAGADPCVSNCILYNNYWGGLFNCDADNSWVLEDIKPVAYWKFDETSGTTVLDSAGINDGVINGASRATEGKLNGALAFDGVDDYVETTLINVENLTLMAWVKILKGNVRQDIMSSHEYGGYGLVYREDGYLTSSIHINGDYRIVYSNEIADLNKWYHVVATYDGDDGYLYVNGVKQDNGFEDDGIITETTMPFIIGANPVGAGGIEKPFDGQIDEVAIYDRALSAREIESMYKMSEAGRDYLDPGFADAENDDYHLISEKGRYWQGQDLWVMDKASSPCIDAGDPNDNPLNEKTPNGARINIGAYGGTVYASMSENPVRGDVNDDGIVDLQDYAIFAQDWLWKADWK